MTKMIAQQGDNNCVARGLSTMRLALGYENAIPDGQESELGKLAPHEILSMCPAWFPNHAVYVVCDRQEANIACDSSCYVGNTIFDNVDDYLIGFSYYAKGAHIAHFVVGAPSLCGDMRLCIVVYVALN